MRPVVSVRPSVFTVFLNSLTFNLDFYMCMSHDHNKPGIESRDRRPRSKVKNVRARRVSTAASYEY